MIIFIFCIKLLRGEIIVWPMTDWCDVTLSQLSNILHRITDMEEEEVEYIRTTVSAVDSNEYICTTLSAGDCNPVNQ